MLLSLVSLVACNHRQTQLDGRTKHEYSNESVALAGHVIEVTLGASYEALLVDHVFRPLGITSGGFGMPGKDNPWGHGEQSEWKPNRRDNPTAITPAGRVHMSIIDWARFCGAIASADVARV